MRGNSSWGVSDGGWSGDNWSMGSIGGDWSMSDRKWGGMSGISGDWGSIAGDWGSVAGDGSVSDSESIIGDSGVVFANARERTVDGFRVGGNGLSASKTTDYALVRSADGWGGVGGGVCGSGIRGYGRGAQQTGIGVSQYSGEEYVLKN